MKNKVVLIPGKHFTPKGLMNYLNTYHYDNISMHKSQPFTINDIHQYVLQKRLPRYLYSGLMGIRRIDREDIGLTYLELYNIVDEHRESNL